MSRVHVLAAGAAAVVALLAVAVGARGQIGQPQPQDPAAKAFLDAGPKVPMTVLPVRLLGRAQRNVGDALGLVLEKSGMTSLDPSPTTFDPAADAAWSDVRVGLAEFLRTNPIRTGYALYAEILGTPQEGCNALRWVIVDAAGQVVLTENLEKGNAELERLLGAKPEPMTCCAAIAERIFARAGWKKGVPPARGQGTYERLWAEKSGTPSDEEYAAMKRRLAALKAGLKGARIAVVPTRIDDADDAASATRLAAALKARLGCEAVTAEPIRLDVRGSTNEQKVLWDFARAFRERVRAAPPATDYVLMGDLIANLAQQKVGGVHFVVCDKSGDWVIVDYQNDHHRDFERIAPTTLEDCEKLMVERLAGMLR